MSETRNAKGHVIYFADFTSVFPGWFKLGISFDSVYDRARTLNQGNPHRTLDIPYFVWCVEKVNKEFEDHMHAIYERMYERKNEWFKTDDIHTAIDLFIEEAEAQGHEVIQIHKTLVISEKRKAGPYEKFWPKSKAEIDMISQHNQEYHDGKEE